MRSFAVLLSAALLCCGRLATAQNEGYVGYNLQQRGDEESTSYETSDSKIPIDDLNPVPDVYLNASVHVALISLLVDNITAKVNVDAKVLNLLKFKAGVEASIDQVSLRIENVTAKVELEARLENVVEMIGDVLNVIDLNPIIATLGQEVTDIVDNVTGTLGQEVDSSGNPVKRDMEDDLDWYRLEHNILYSVNDFSGSAHTNRILAQNGSIIDYYLDNNGDNRGEKVVGYYSRDMTFNGHNRTIEDDGEVLEFELQYEYRPFPGLEAICNIYMNPEGKVVRTQVVAESEGGAHATLSDDEDL